MNAIEYQDIEFAQLFFFKDYVISQLNEGVVLDKQKHVVLVKALSDYYKGQPYVYIGYRVHEYNVNPMVYIESRTISNLAGICIVTPFKKDEKTARFESNFYEKEFYVCAQLEEGINWALKIIKELHLKEN